MTAAGDATSIALADGESRTGINAQLTTAATISGTLTGPDNQPLPSATVTVYQHNGNSWSIQGSTSTQAGGSYTLGGLSAGTYRIGFSHGAGGFVAEYYDNTTTFEEATDIVLEGGQARTGIDAQLAPGAAISGTLTGSDGQPLPSAFVRAYVHDASNDTWDLAGSASTQNDGSYTVGGLAAGTYRLEFTDDYRGSHLSEYYENAKSLHTATDIILADGQTRTGINAQLASGATISGTISGPDGAILTNSLVMVQSFAYDASTSRWDAGPSVSARPDGTSTIPGLRAGTYRIKFLDYSGAYGVRFYANASTIEDATDVVLTSGQARTGVDVRLRDKNDAGPQVNLVPPRITGTPQVGATLTADPGAWSPGAQLSYAWSTESAPLPQTTPTLTLTDDLVGHRLRVSVTATWAGGATATATSDLSAAVTRPTSTPTPVPTPPTPTPPAPAGPIVLSATTKPAVTGTPKVGKTLRVTTGSWNVAGAKVKITWLANGKAIKKATKTKTKLTKALRGRKITVRLVVTAPGATPLTVTLKTKGRVKA